MDEDQRDSSYIRSHESGSTMGSNSAVDACRFIEAKMKEAAADEAYNESEERRHRIIKEAARVRKESLRAVILDLVPDYVFGSGEDGDEEYIDVTVIPSSTVLAEPKSTHKRNYGKWAKIAKDTLRLAGGSGTFPELKEIAMANMMVAPNTSDKDMEGLRGALHGLARRGRISYLPGEGGAGGVFSNQLNIKDNG
ncbi:MAG: hypothetical protein ACO1NQ_04490 [Flavobacteriales bacterium]